MSTVLALYEAGVRAVESATASFESDDWDRPTPCIKWRAGDVAGHLRVVAGWYHDWLDRAEAGVHYRPFRYARLKERNAAALRDLPVADGPFHVAAFAESARRYAARLPEAWDRRYGFPRGTVTAGQHGAVAALEWHLHAWDLASAVHAPYRPADPEGLYLEAGEALAVAGWLGRPLAPFLRGLLHRRFGGVDDAWHALLRASGRNPLNPVPDHAFGLR